MRLRFDIPLLRFRFDVIERFRFRVCGCCDKAAQCKACYQERNHRFLHMAFILELRVCKFKPTES